MKHLFLARHGDYEDGGTRLSNSGRQQIGLLSFSIKDIINGSFAYIVSSTSTRASESAKILGARLNLSKEIELDSYLVDLNRECYPKCYNDSMAFIDKRRDNADGLIIVTHKSEVRDLAEWFMKKEFGIEHKCEYYPDFGQAIHINLENRFLQFLPKRA